MKTLNIINYKNIFLFIFSVLSIITSCTEDFEETNTDPNNPKEVDIPLIFTSGERSILYKYGRFTEGTDWDLWCGLWIQTFAGNHGNGVNYDLYDILPNASLWDRQYDALNDLKIVISLGTEREAWQHVGASKIISALALGTLTSQYGGIPWSEALVGSENPNPKFDTQEEIYNSMFSLLSEGIADLDKTSSIQLGAEDFVFHNSAAASNEEQLNKWKALAYALEARYRNHFSIKDPSGSATAALTAVDNAKSAGFTEHAYDLVFPYEGADIYRNGYYHLFQNNQMIASEVFMNTLTSTNDPRKEAYWNTEATDGTVVGYTGKSNGFGTDNASYSPVGPQGFYGKETSPQLISTHFELLFIEAEAALRSGDAERAATAHNAAIIAQLNLVTPSAIEFLTSSGGDVSTYQAKINTYIAAFADEDAGSITIEKIMTEKHKAMFTMNTESWVDVRRHNYDYPATLSIPTNDGKAIATEFIQRVPYPEESTNTNSNTPDGVTIFDQLWIFKAN
ncbi:SusD/RagB family nutrient-binding outer membrane lipoprotein [Aquimarina sp. 2201CG1-2-11]|uniref:SusD/RagB family nutrient-binding outer membrane lipoprotein n=1 Tax=Aquimarina discodermiae TaxID=3231043 RepID=UPI003462F889